MSRFLKTPHLIIVIIIFLFSAQVMAAPSAPTNIQVNPGQGRITITWSPDANAEWYQVYVGTADFSASLLFEWYPSSICSANVCTLMPNIDLLAGDYVVYVRSYGAGEYSTGGLDGWGGPAEFTLSNQSPSNVSVNVSNPESRNPTFSWQQAQRATWYYVWVGTVTPRVALRYSGWHLASELGCTTGVCNLNVQNMNLPDGQYVTYMQVWGPGGLSSGTINGVPNWIEGPSFTIGTPPAADEVSVVDLLNAERARMGLGCVVINPLLTQAAYNHSVDMQANIGTLSHVGSDGSRFWERIARTGYGGDARGENIALGYATPTSVYNGWFNSPGHNTNMFNPNSNEIGVARVGNYWTMVLAYSTGVDATCY